MGSARASHAACSVAATRATSAVATADGGSPWRGVTAGGGIRTGGGVSGTASAWLAGVARMVVVAAIGGVLSMPSAPAATIYIDIDGPFGYGIAGGNAGVPEGEERIIPDFVMPGMQLAITNGAYGYRGLHSPYTGFNQLEFMVAELGFEWKPRRFGSGEAIGPGIPAGSHKSETTFLRTSPSGGVTYFTDFDAPGRSFLGLKFTRQPGVGDPLVYYGYLEVTWSHATSRFEILSGAYESTAGDSITTPTLAAGPVPEIDPAGTGAILALVAGAAGLLERRRVRG